MDAVAVLVALAIVAVLTVDAAARRARADAFARMQAELRGTGWRVERIRLIPYARASLTLDVDRCRVCGCTDEEACPGGCWWVIDPHGLGSLCSACVGRAA